jgi:hypothetical protein
MPNFGHIKKNRCPKAKELKRKHTSAFLVLDTVAENAKRKMDEGHALLELGEAIITAEECGVTKHQFSHALNFLEKDGMIHVIHRGRKDKNSILQKRTGIKTESTRTSTGIKTGINGTVVKLIDSECYDINIEDNRNQNRTQTGINTREKPAQTRNEETKNTSFKKETNKEKKIIRSFFRPPLSHKEKNEAVESFLAYSDLHQLGIPQKDFSTWLRKHSKEKIIENLKMLVDQKNTVETPVQWLQRALIVDYAGAKKNIAENKKFAENFKAIHKWKSLTILEQYCRDEETGNDYQYSLPPESFRRMLEERYQLNKGII